MLTKKSHRVHNIFNILGIFAVHLNAELMAARRRDGAASAYTRNGETRLWP